MVINGYKITGCDLSKVQDELKKTEEKIKQIAKKEYAALLSEKCAFLCDAVALGMCDRPTDHAIADDAVTQLSDEIALAGRLGTRVRENFNIYAHILAQDGDVYIWVISTNDRFLKAFNNFPDYSLSDDESTDKDNQKTKRWLQVFDAARVSEPLSINLTHIPEPDTDRLKFASPGKRAEKMARHSLLNQYLNLLSGGRQIPPVYMMEYVDRAMGILLSHDGQLELKAKTTQVAQILPDINKDPDIVLKPYPGGAGAVPEGTLGIETADTEDVIDKTKTTQESIKDESVQDISQDGQKGQQDA